MITSLLSDGLEESTFWIALALEQHRVGRLQENVKSQALQRIDSGRALQDWGDLADGDVSSIAARDKVLRKARETILSAATLRRVTGIFNSPAGVLSLSLLTNKNRAGLKLFDVSYACPGWPLGRFGFVSSPFYFAGAVPYWC